jgi:hypothetical protein
MNAKNNIENIAEQQQFELCTALMVCFHFSPCHAANVQMHCTEHTQLQPYMAKMTGNLKQRSTGKLLVKYKSKICFLFVGHLCFCCYHQCRSNLVVAHFVQNMCAQCFIQTKVDQWA